MVFNRWMKIAESGSSSVSFVISEDHLKIQKVAVKVSHIRFEFRKVVNKAGTDLDKLDHVHWTVKQLSTDMDDGDGSGGVMSKAEFMANVVGQKLTQDVKVKVPNICKNKGSALKRYISLKEKAMNNANKKPQKGKQCKATAHNYMKCPRKREKKYSSCN